VAIDSEKAMRLILVGSAELQPADHRQRDQAGHQQPQRQIDDA
jgi:hypothetical protein